MKCILLSLVLATAACQGCAHVPAPVVDIAACADSSITPKVQEILGKVANDLASSNYDDLLLTLGAEVGVDVVKCAVEELVHRSRMQLAGAPKDPVSGAIFRNGSRWLEMHSPPSANVETDAAKVRR